jgi:uncharacterized protein YndB with AHSA1/START domain
MTTNTIQLHRVLKAAPEKVYRAFMDADAMARWARIMEPDIPDQG